MGQLNFGKRECARAVEKIGGKRRTTKESNAWYMLDGRRLFRVTIPKGKAGDFAIGTKKNIVNQFRLTNEQFGQLHECTLSGTDYESLIRAKMAEGKI